ncbi:hypothetical protein CJ178_04150 [Rhodococcus sp. ACPA4]|nr:hypothetical protein CJ178_04150 [Rhodococcus sp. ACPA4]
MMPQPHAHIRANSSTSQERKTYVRFTILGLSTDDGANVAAVLQKRLSAYNHPHLTEDLLISQESADKARQD